MSARPTPDTEHGWTAIGLGFYTTKIRESDFISEKKFFAQFIPRPPTPRFKLQDFTVAWQVDGMLGLGQPGLSFQLEADQVMKFIFDVLNESR